MKSPSSAWKAVAAEVTNSGPTTFFDVVGDDLVEVVVLPGLIVMVGLSVPVVLASGDPAYNIGPNGNQLYDTAALDSQGISWLALHGKLRITRGVSRELLQMADYTPIRGLHG